MWCGSWHTPATASMIQIYTYIWIYVIVYVCINLWSLERICWFFFVTLLYSWFSSTSQANAFQIHFRILCAKVYVNINVIQLSFFFIFIYISMVKWNISIIFLCVKFNFLRLFSRMHNLFLLTHAQLNVLFWTLQHIHKHIYRFFFWFDNSYMN